MESETNHVDGIKQRSCNVNSTFNTIVGVVAIAAALLIGYAAYSYWWA